MAVVAALRARQLTAVASARPLAVWAVSSLPARRPPGRVPLHAAWIRAAATAAAPTTTTAPSPPASGSATDATGRRAPRSTEIAQLLRLARPVAPQLGGALGLLLVSSAVSMAIPMGMGRVIDLATTGGGVGLPVPQLVAGGTAIFALAAGAVFGRSVLMRKPARPCAHQLAGETVVRDLRRDLFNAIAAQEMAFFDSNRTGELINRLSTDTTLVGKAITNNLADGVRSLVQATVGVSMMVYISPKLALVMLSIVPPLAAGAIVYGRFVRNISRRTQDALSETTKVAEERFSNIRTVRAFAQERNEMARYAARVLDVYRLARREAFVSGGFNSAISFSANMAIMAMILSGSSMVKAGTITVGDLASYMLYTGYVGGSIMGVSSFYTELMRGVGASTRIFELKDRKPAVPLSGGFVPTTLEGRVELRDVTFRYPTRPDVAILQKSSMVFAPKTMTAIVGESGSGKSTVGALLLRFYDPEEGAVLVDGNDVRTLDPSWLRRQVGWVGQEPVLFSGTIRDNIAYSRPDATDEEVIEAAKQANAYDFIVRFPQGFETNVGERGLSLSGGQKQRIAIARALLTNPTILILDEATSALDAESEHLVHDALERLMQHRTVITIAHRLSTIQAASQVIVLANGRAAEVGTYNELLARPNGLFRKLVNRQSGALE